MTDAQQLLAQYAATGSETAFRELVSRYVDLVYSAAVRLANGDTHLAEDVSQTVFTDLARMAPSLSREVMLGGWLHRHACFVASNTLRGERRRRERERQAVEMSTPDDRSEANLKLLTPILDEAVNQLGPEDRTAILLRFFEQYDFRSLGEALGSSEEAARKRVDRALDRLHGLLKARGVTLSGSALATTLATHSVSAAPAGFALAVSSAALAGVATGAATTLTAFEFMSTTKLKVGIIAAVIAAGVSIPWAIQARAKLASANAAMQELADRNDKLSAEVTRLGGKPAPVAPAAAARSNPPLELVRLRGEVARLRQLVASEQVKSPISSLKANPTMWNAIRDQNKASMTSAYKDFATGQNLSPEQTEKLNDLLTDNIMENVDLITDVLREGATDEAMEPIFAGQEAALLEKVQELLGPDGFSKYQDYTRDLGSLGWSKQIKGAMTGDTAEREAKSQQLYEVLVDETRQTKANAGLPENFQTVTTLNFRNIASESEAEKNLSLVEGILERAATRAASFLSPEDLAKFAEARATAIKNSRMSLTMNRKMMSPAAK